MDKPTKTKKTVTLMRNGFALLITLSVLAVLMALTGVLLGYFDQVHKDATRTKALMQGDLYYADSKKIIDSFKDRKTLFGTLYQTPIPLSSPDGRFNILLQCSPRANGVNINWLGKEGSLKMAEQYKVAEQLFESIAQNYEIKDASRLEELIQEATQSKKMFIAEENYRLLQKNGIITRKQFDRILQKYQFETDDDKISKIPWSKYFTFGHTGSLIDGDYISAELLSVLFDIDIATVKEEWTEGTTKLKDFVVQRGGTYNEKLFAKKFIEEAQCSVQYTYQNERFAFTFIDDEGEVKDFEFQGKQ